jgi:hypothetical protein
VCQKNRDKSRNPKNKRPIMPLLSRRDSSSSIGEQTPDPSAHGGQVRYVAHPDDGPVLTHALGRVELKGEVRERGEREQTPISSQSPNAFSVSWRETGQPVAAGAGAAAGGRRIRLAVIGAATAQQ